jgi:hypothetical protein
VVLYDVVLRTRSRARSLGTGNTIGFVLEVDAAGCFHLRDQDLNLFVRDVRRAVQHVEQQLARRERQRRMRASDRSAYRCGWSAALDALEGPVDSPVVDDGAPSAARG